MRSALGAGRSACAEATMPKSTVTTVTISRTRVPSHGFWRDPRRVVVGNVCANFIAVSPADKMFSLLAKYFVSIKGYVQGCMRCGLLHGFAGDPAVWDDVIASWTLREAPIAIALPG